MSGNITAKGFSSRPFNFLNFNTVSSQNGEQTLSEEQINQVYQVYHADDLWYDYYEQVAYLAITAVKLQYTDGSTLYLSGNSLAACVW